MSGPLGDGDPPSRRGDLDLETLAVSEPTDPVEVRVERSAVSEPTDPVEVLAERLAVDLAAVWRAGRPRAVEGILEAHPQLRDHPHAAVRLIYEEICLRQELGLGGASADDVLGRFPRYRDELSILLAGHRLLAPDTEPPAFPRVGDVFDGATLLAELGRGGAGRVFLAAQSDLADRPVVLKVTPNFGDEHLTLARLQHTHVVPLYAARVVPEADLRVLCMPYLGHTTFARLLDALRDQPPRGRAGADIVRVIVEAQAGSPVPLASQGPGINWLARASYEHAVCWVGACLAQALHYAHERGLVHLDVKPSNVLLTADGTPMLLDFHLARGPIHPEESSLGRIGGTLAYMSPEQADVLADARAGRKITAGVDARSDVYSLGLILYEALGGARQDASEASARRLRRANPNVSPALAALIARCLARDPHRRYPNAKALAEDLHRHLADQPLKGVANRNLPERWRKWRRRRPHTPALLAMGLAVAVAVGLVGASTANHWAQRLRAARAALAHVPADGRADAAAVRDMENALALVRATPGGRDLARQLAARLRVAERVSAADRLHLVVDRLRFGSAAEALDPDEVSALMARCRDVWAARGRFLDTTGPPLPAGLDRQVREDLRDLVILSAGFVVPKTPSEIGSPARRAALRRLDEAEALFGPCAALERQRAALADAEGLHDLARTSVLRAAAYPPKSAGDYYELGLAQLQAGDLERAAEALERACRLHPESFWPNFHRGLCAARTSRFMEAVEAFSICVAQRPESAPCFAHRGQAWQALDRLELAERDFDRATILDPKLAGAWTNLGALKIRTGRHREAIANLHRALDAGGSPAAVHYDLALAHLALGDRGEARIEAQAALRHDSSHASARALLARLSEE